MMYTVKLKNGTEEDEALVNTVLHSLNGLLETEGVGDLYVFYDLVELCRNGTTPAAPRLKELQYMKLVLDDGSVHDSVKNIVLSGVSGEELNMKLEDPRCTCDPTEGS